MGSHSYTKNLLQLRTHANIHHGSICAGCTHPEAIPVQFIASRDGPHGEATSTISDVVGHKKEEFQCAPVAQSCLCLLSDNEKFVPIDGSMGDLDHRRISSKPSIVLAVSVSSAVKLEARQVELIARKMQKLTGFRNLRLENTVDPSLIAGFTISYGDDESNVIDLSVKGQLAALAARVESSERRTDGDPDRDRWSEAEREATRTSDDLVHAPTTEPRSR